MKSGDGRGSSIMDFKIACATLADLYRQNAALEITKREFYLAEAAKWDRRSATEWTIHLNRRNVAAPQQQLRDQRLANSP